MTYPGNVPLFRQHVSDWRRQLALQRNEVCRFLFLQECRRDRPQQPLYMIGQWNRTEEFAALAIEKGLDFDILYKPLDLGKLLNCTFDEFKRYSFDSAGRYNGNAKFLKYIRPFDANPEDVNAFIIEREQRAAQQRAARKAARDSDDALKATRHAHHVARHEKIISSYRNRMNDIQNVVEALEVELERSIKARQLAARNLIFRVDRAATECLSLYDEVFQSANRASIYQDIVADMNGLVVHVEWLDNLIGQARRSNAQTKISTIDRARNRRLTIKKKLSAFAAMCEELGIDPETMETKK